jgi:hypothetical protein
VALYRISLVIIESTRLIYTATGIAMLTLVFLRVVDLVVVEKSKSKLKAIIIYLLIYMLMGCRVSLPFIVGAINDRRYSDGPSLFTYKYLLILACLLPGCTSLTAYHLCLLQWLSLFTYHTS